MSNALKLGLRTLEYLAQAPRSASDVARHLDVDRSTGWRILQVLIEFGWVKQDTGPASFSLNVTQLYSLAGNSHQHLALPGLVTPALTKIRDEIGESAVLGVPSGSSMVYLALTPSLHAVTVREGVGSVRPMHASALGKAYLSALNGKELEDTLISLDFQGGTERTVKSARELRSVIAEARGQGYATDLEECFAGVVCVAVPVQVGQGRLLIGALGVSGPRERLTVLGVERVAQVIKEEVVRLEANFDLASSVGAAVPDSSTLA
jgi:IclR family acetate operon transcriptional repressor